MRNDEPVSVAESSALELVDRARSLANTGDFPAAETTLIAAVPLALTLEEQCLVDGVLAYVEAELGRCDEAMHRLQQALARSGLDRVVRARLDGQAGLVHWLAGRVSESIEAFDAALAYVHDDYRWPILLNRGTALLVQGDFEQARRDFAEGCAVEDVVMRAKNQHNLGYVHLLRGDLIEALRLMDTAAPHFVALGPGVTAIADLDRAEALEAAGLADEAIGLLRAVVTRLEGTDLWRLLSDVEVRLAGLVGGEEAIALAARAADRCVAHGNESLAAWACAVGLHARARAGLAVTAEEFDDIADVLARVGRPDAVSALRARAAFLRDEELPPLAPSASLATRLLDAELRIRQSFDARRHDEALQRAAVAVDGFEAWQQAIGSLELQVSTMRLVGDIIRLAQRAAFATGRPAALLEWSERARELASRGVSSRPPEELGDALARLRHLGPDGDPHERVAVIEQIRRGRWQAEGSVNAVDVVDLDQVRAALGGATFVSVLRIGDEAVALVVGERVDVRILGPWQLLQNQLSGLAADLAASAQTSLSVVRAGLVERLRDLDAIMSPAWRGARRLVLTVPSELSHVPWGQLPSLASVPVALPASATAWVGAATLQAPASAAIAIGPRTRTGASEAERIAGAWRASATVEDLARCDRVADLARQVDVLHVSAHGHDRDGHPLLASVELADGDWFGHDVELLASVPQIVVLSACGVGGGSLGMTRAWLYAGAQRVIAAPADISEAAAAERFPVLHTLLAAGASPEEAVAQAFGADALDCAVQCYGPA